jgi:hypothetical protein
VKDYSKIPVSSAKAPATHTASGMRHGKVFIANAYSIADMYRKLEAVIKTC